MPERHTLLIVIAGTLIGMPACDGRLAGRDLTLTGLQDLAHDHVVDLLGSDAAALERGLDRDGAEVHRAELRERTGELADRRAGGRDDDGTGHGGLHEASCR